MIVAKRKPIEEIIEETQTYKKNTSGRMQRVRHGMRSGR